MGHGCTRGKCLFFREKTERNGGLLNMQRISKGHVYFSLKILKGSKGSSLRGYFVVYIWKKGSERERQKKIRIKLSVYQYDVLQYNNVTFLDFLLHTS